MFGRNWPGTAASGTPTTGRGRRRECGAAAEGVRSDSGGFERCDESVDVVANVENEGYGIGRSESGSGDGFRDSGEAGGRGNETCEVSLRESESEVSISRLC